MKNYAKIGMLAAALFSMWGILYPEMYLHPDVIRIVSQEDNGIFLDSPAVYAGFLDAGDQEITVRFKWAECLEQLLHSEENEAASGEKQTE